MGPFGSVIVPITYEIPVGTEGVDPVAIHDYVYGSLDEKSLELHALNHLLKAGLTKKISMKEDFKSFVGPSAQSMDRSNDKV